MNYSQYDTLGKVNDFIDNNHILQYDPETDFDKNEHDYNKSSLYVSVKNFYETPNGGCDLSDAELQEKIEKVAQCTEVILRGYKGDESYNLLSVEPDVFACSVWLLDRKMDMDDSCLKNLLDNTWREGKNETSSKKNHVYGIYGSAAGNDRLQPQQ